MLYRRALNAEVYQERKKEDTEERLQELENERYTGERMVKELQRWQAMKAAFLDKTFVSVPSPPIVEKLLMRVGIKEAIQDDSSP